MMQYKSKSEDGFHLKVLRTKDAKALQEVLVTYKRINPLMNIVFLTCPFGLSLMMEDIYKGN